MMKFYVGLVVLGSSLSALASEASKLKMWKENVDALESKMKDGTLTIRWYYPNIQNLSTDGAIIFKRDDDKLRAIALQYKDRIVDKANKFIEDPHKLNFDEALNLYAEVMFLSHTGTARTAHEAALNSQLLEKVRGARYTRSDSDKLSKEIQDASELQPVQAKKVAPPLPPKPAATQAVETKD